MFRLGYIIKFYRMVIWAISSTPPRRRKQCCKRFSNSIQKSWTYLRQFLQSNDSNRFAYHLLPRRLRNLFKVFRCIDSFSAKWNQSCFSIANRHNSLRPGSPPHSRLYEHFVLSAYVRRVVRTEGATSQCKNIGVL